MTTGLPLYLVSACGSPEEFVAAFRRYADRTGLFVPSAAPLPAGRRGRLAITLSDGGVMIEGEAEILQSSAKPTVLHGRPGMTVKFVEPDEPSKTVIGELEKARLAMKPAPPSVPPRPAEIPATPRPVVPAPNGRIDAANALAECIVIGDPASLREIASGPGGSGSRFVVPSIPAVGSPRPNSPSTPPPPRPKTPTAPPPERAKTPTIPPDPAATPLPKPAPSARMTSIGFPIIDKAPATTESARVVTNVTMFGMPALERKPQADVKADAVAPPPPAPSSLADEEATAIGVAPPRKQTDPMPPIAPDKTLIEPIIDDEATAIGELPIPKPTEPMPAAVPIATADDASAARRAESAKHKATSIGFPVVRNPYETQPLGLVPPAVSIASLLDVPADPAPPTLPKSTRSAPPPGPRGRSPTAPPYTARHPTPLAPVPIVRLPSKAAPAAVTEEEQTDLSTVPTTPALPLEAPAADSDASKPAPAPRSGGMRASEILAAIPAGDWTMAPDESVPHALPDEAKVTAPPSEPTPAPGPPPGPPTGDWTISLDPQTGWSDPKAGAAPAIGNPIVSVSSDKPINVMEWEEKSTGIGESKIEIDSTLMDPANTVSPFEAKAATARAGDSIPPPLGAMPPRPSSGYATSEPSPFAIPSAAPPYPVQDLRSFGVTSPTAATSAPGKRHKMIALAVGAVAIAIGAIVMLVLSVGSKNATTSQAAIGSGGGSAKVTAPVAPLAEQPAGSDTETKPAAVAVAPPAATEEPPPPAAPTTCKVTVTSIPPGADVVVAKQKLATTPGTIELPCGSDTKVTLRKKSFPNAVRTFTPTAGKSNKLVVKLTKSMLSVKVTSAPAGATITAGGKSMGVTPTTIKLPANESSTISLSKPGFANDTQRISPRQNNASHHVTLKKGKSR